MLLVNQVTDECRSCLILDGQFLDAFDDSVVVNESLDSAV